MAFNFLSLITRFASVQFPSCSTDLGMQCAYDSYLVFDVKHGGIVGCSGGSRLSHGTHRRQSEFDVIGLIYQALS